jgi:3-deoxy-D-manno-octulosonic-acid transferase
LDALGVKFVHRNRINAAMRYSPDDVKCLLLNSGRDLVSFWEHATLIFLGNTFGAHGGQDPLEPALLGKPLVFGPTMRDFAALARRFKAQNAAIQVEDASALQEVLAELLSDTPRCDRLGQNAQALARDVLRPIERICELVLKIAPSQPGVTGVQA